MGKDFFGVLAALGSALLCAASALGAQRTQPTADYVKGELIVRLKPGTGVSSEAAAIAALERALGTRAVQDFRHFRTDSNMANVKLAPSADLAAAIQALAHEPAVAYAEPNWIYRALDDGTPNDPDFNKLWGLKNTGQADSKGQLGTPGADINVLPLWQAGITGSRNVVVAVIDTGIDWNHPDLAANIYTNPGESGPASNNGKDDDGNGFIDDVHGWNFADNNNNPLDNHDHGSHCSGTIGGAANNGIGVAGINWNVSLMPVKFLDAQGGGTNEAAIEAINYARLMKVNIMSNSWGGGAFSQGLKDAVQAVKDAGILFVAAAGNNGSDNDSTPSYPASYGLDNIVSVAATDNQDKLASFSNFGAKSVHVAAPGVNIYSTTKGGKYDTLSGTSMATPHVAGIAALLLGANPSWSYSEIKRRLIETSDPVRALHRKVAAHGRVNAYNALHGIIPPSPDPDESLWKSDARVIESAHPYEMNSDRKFKVEVPGAKYIRVFFEKVEVERNYDKVFVETPAGEAVDEITGSTTDYTSEYVPGDTAIIHLKADNSVNGYGFKVSKVQFIKN